MATKTTTFSDQVSKRRQKLRALGISSLLIKTEHKSEFDPWQLIKRSNVDSSYSLVLKYRSAIYPTAPATRRSRSNTPAHIHRRRKNTETVMTSDSDGRSSVQSNHTELEGEAGFKDDFDYDAEEPVEPPQYPHLVHKPGTYIQELYLKACKEFQIPASKYFYKNLTGEAIILRRQGLGPIGMKACAIALMEILKVHTLDLTDNNLGSEGARYLAELMAENLFIKHLIVSDNNLGYSGVKKLVDTLKATDSLISLNVSGNGLGDRQVEALRPIIEDTNNLKCLNVSNNELGEEGGRIIGEALCKAIALSRQIKVWSDTLQTLDLSWNHLRKNGVIRIAEALTKNTGLLVLNLSWNGLHTTECEAIGKALEKNSTLTELDISCNRINRKCLDLLINSLKKNTSLKTLKLGPNPLLPEDALVLLMFVKDNPSIPIQQLDLEDILVDQPFIDLLEEIRNGRILNVTRGNLRGPDMLVHDHDEGILLKEDSWSVIQELGNVVGLDILAIFMDISKETHVLPRPDQVIASLALLLNPMTERCTRILVSRLEKTAEGFLDFRHIANEHKKREKSKKSSRHESHFNLMKYMADDDYCDEYDRNVRGTEDDEDARVRIRQCLFRVITRKLCASTEYRRELEWSSQDGGEFLKYRIMKNFKENDLGPDGRHIIQT